MSAVAALVVEWERPVGLWALALPLLVWWLARRARGAPAEATGTLELWREVAREHPPARAGRRPSFALWLALAALACGAVALAGPRAAHAREPVTWRVAVDRSPSMYLPHDGAGGDTRLAVALERARALLLSARAAGDALEWLASDGQTASGERLPAAWSDAPRAPLPELDWRALDAAGTLVVTDRAPAKEPVHAGVAASGGAVAPGVVAAEGGDAIVWNGTGLETRAGGTAQPRVRFAGGMRQAPSLLPLLRVIDAWSASRGVASNSVGDCELELAFTSDGAPREIEAGRDGWTASGSAVAVSATNGTSAWLSTSIDGEPIDVVRWRAGRVEIGWRSMDEPRGDAAAFAVSWAQLFDAALLPQRGVVALDERRSAGAASQRAPERPVGAQSGATRAAAVLTALAALLALAALALRR